MPVNSKHFELIRRWSKCTSATLTALMVVLGTIPASAQQSPASREALVKAAMVYNFIRFIEWPGESKNSRVVCTYQGSNLSPAMQSIAGKPVGDAEISVRELQDAEEIAVCDVFVTTESDGYTFRDENNDLVKQAVLTVSDKPGFASRGGIIGFTQQDGRVGFEVNVDQATARGLKFSSRLLRLATIISSDEVGE